jgi:abortive infection Abi-like protein
MLENILLAACEGHRTSNQLYIQLRGMLLAEPSIKGLLPSFVRASRDLNHFWSYIKGQSGQWEPRRIHVREQITPLIDYLEGAHRAPVDPIVSDVLQNFDAEGVHKVWAKALERRHADPEGAITSARTLLETVCKRVLDETGTEYAEKDDLPALYKVVATKLNLAPGQHTEETFRRILGGATSVVEGLGSLRNKIGDAHGHGKNAVRPSARHAQLAVDLAGTMATLIVETWNERKE